MGNLSPLGLRGLLQGLSVSDAPNRLIERPRLSVINLRLDPSDAQHVKPVLKLDLPLAPNKVVRDRDGHAAYWLGPDEWLIVSETTDSGELEVGFNKALRSQHHSVVDLSSNYDCLRLSGPGAREVLERTTPLDLSAAAFAYGDCVQTIAARANVLITLVDDGDAGPTFDLFVRRSFAQYLWGYLLDSGKRVGLVGSR